ncbi:MAG: hypothetical protein WB646_06130 [Steroidobacteraceae bacterium]
MAATDPARLRQNTAVIGQTSGGRLADARDRAGDERDLAGEIDQQIFTMT